MGIYEKLATIQQKLVAPKGQYNSFGKYRYRSCEDILEALKPLLLETKTVLFIKDDIEAIGNRVYVKATASIHDTESDGVVEVTASAREEETKKGMDSSQVTGATSSYARKYALNGLFCIDDTKDPDTENYTVQQNNQANEKGAKQPGDDVGKSMAEEIAQAENQPIDSIKTQTLLDMIAKDKVDSNKLFTLYKIKGLSEITNKKFVNMVNNWKKIVEQCPAVNEGEAVLFG